LEYQYFSQTILTFAWDYRSVPTKNDILAPETVLKKRKSQEKERELRAVETKKKKDVSKAYNFFNNLSFLVMTSNFYRG
jgi:hypothetical protein